MITVNVDTVFATPLTEEEQLAADKLEAQAQAKAYLASTAWYVERLNDPSSGKPIPTDVLEARAKARELL